jgi:hypothetical protein
MWLAAVDQWRNKRFKKNQVRSPAFKKVVLLPKNNILAYLCEKRVAAVKNDYALNCPVMAIFNYLA